MIIAIAFIWLERAFLNSIYPHNNLQWNAHWALISLTHTQISKWWSDHTSNKSDDEEFDPGFEDARKMWKEMDEFLSNLHQNFVKVSSGWIGHNSP